MKKLALVSIIAAALFGALALPAGSQTPDTLDVLVSPAVVLAVNINEAEWDLGPRNLSTADTPATSRTSILSGSTQFQVTNTGNSAAKLMIGATDAIPVSGGATWALNCSPPILGTVGNNNYVLRVFKNGDDATTAEAFCTGVDKVLAPSVDSGSLVSFRLQYNMPTGTTGFGERKTTITITAVQP